MAATKWTRFFWSDWSSDEALRSCSLAAQGLWMRMLCVAAQHDPIGYVAVNGRPLEVVDIAKIAGVDSVEAGDLLTQLDRTGVFSRDRKGCIYSRRMLKEHLAAIRDEENGKKGGSPTLCNTTENYLPVNPPDNLWVIPHIPESNSQKVRLPPVVPPPGGPTKGNRLERGTRITSDWQPSAKNCERCIGLGVDREAAVIEFINYWIAVPGQKGRKLDWDATFYNRCTELHDRRALQSKRGSGRSGPQSAVEAGFAALDRIRSRQ